ncbi:MAG: hypothetical protein KQH59_18115 [Desulfobulbaceae bacterium]|nr:hypothetical protein [Desulfobulbaceae bacterium]
MIGKIMNKKMISRVLLVVLFFSASASYGEVLYSDDFEWGSDWNSSMDNTLPGANGWNGVSASDMGGSYETIYVNSAAGYKSGSRAMVQYWDSGTGSTHESWLMQQPISGWSFPNEYYIGYWFKVDTNWDWGSAASLKTWKVNYTTGDVTWDIGWLSGFIAYCGDDWCNVDGTNWTGDSGCEAALHTDEEVAEVFGCWSDVDDGEWHYFVWHINHSGEVIEVSIDGNDASQMSPSGSYGSPFTEGVGTTRFNFGGNFSAGGGGYDEMYTAYDDLIVATSQAEVESFLGVSSEAATPSINGIPTIIGVTIQ